MASFIVEQGRTHLLDHKIRRFLQSSFLSHNGVAQLISGLAYEPVRPFEVDQVGELSATGRALSPSLSPAVLTLLSRLSQHVFQPSRSPASLHSEITHSHPQKRQKHLF